jgi:hypothetical protein
MMRRTQTLVRLGRKYVTAARFPISARVGYGTIIPATARILSPRLIASVQAVISSPAAHGFALGLRAVVLVIGPAQHPDRDAARPRFGFGQADMGELGVGEGHPRHEIRVHLHGQAKQRVPDDETGVIVREMGELAAAHDVADGIDAPVGGLEALVHHDAAAVAGNAGALEREPVRVRFAAGRDQEMAALDRLRVVAKDDLDLRSRAFRARDRDVAANRNALALERVEHDRRAFAIFARERLTRLQHRDRGTEPAKGLRKLEPDRTRADDDEMLRPRGEIEHGLVGEIEHSIKAGDRWKQGRGAGRDDEASRCDRDSVDNHSVAIRKARGAFDHPHAEAIETLPGIVRRDRGDDVVHVPVNLGEVDVRRWCRHAEGRRVSDQARALARGNQRFRWNAAGVETLAAHLGLLDQHHRHAEGGRCGGNRQAARAGTDDADVGYETFCHAFSKCCVRTDCFL